MQCLKQSSKEKSSEFQFLVEEARRLGAIEAKIVTPGKVVVEDRVLLKCKTGCNAYGHRFVCPPYTPTPQEFRKILREYRAILVAKFPAEAEADEDVGRSLVKNLCAPDTPADLRTQTKEFWDTWGGDKRRILLAMLALEKAAFNQGLHSGDRLDSRVLRPLREVQYGGNLYAPFDGAISRTRPRGECEENAQEYRDVDHVSL